jgi:hypothetical protein
MTDSDRTPLVHLSGPEYLAVWRGIRPEPPRPYSWDTNGLTHAEYSELMAPLPTAARTQPKETP